MRSARRSSGVSGLALASQSLGGSGSAFELALRRAWVPSHAGPQRWHVHSHPSLHCSSFRSMLRRCFSFSAERARTRHPASGGTALALLHRLGGDRLRAWTLHPWRNASCKHVDRSRLRASRCPSAPVAPSQAQRRAPPRSRWGRILLALADQRRSASRHGHGARCRKRPRHGL